MGYQDAKAKHEELKKFFMPDGTKRWFFFRKEKSPA
jgi:hypothetical protein